MDLLFFADRIRRSKFEVPRLPEEFDGVVVDDLLDLRIGVAAFAHFHDEIGDGDGIGGAPVAGGVYEQALRAIEVTTSRAIVMEILLLFILSSFLSYGDRQKGEIR